MSKKISFIHCADLHIDSPFKGLRQLSSQLFDDIRNSTFHALDHLVSLAIEKQVDFVLIVGDLFDSEQQSLKAQTHLRKAFEKLEQHNIEVYLSFGNHDYLEGRLFDYSYPANVHVFEQEQVTHFSYKDLATIYGFSYQNRSVLDNKTSEYEKSSDTPYHIGTLHGSISSNTDHDVYAPFQLSELLEKEFDYWALGHIHKRQLLKQHPPIVYPGNIQGRSKKETDEKGCYFVELDQHNQTLEFCPLQYIRFEQEELDVSSCLEPQQLEMKLDQWLTTYKQKYPRSILSLTLTSEHSVLHDWHQAGYIEELIEFFNDNHDNPDSWVLIQAIQIQEHVSWDREQLKESQHFISELLEKFDQTSDVQAHLHALSRHRQARKYVQPFTEEEQEDIKQEAEQLLLHHLLKE